jgi:proline iminopeptidase
MKASHSNARAAQQAITRHIVARDGHRIAVFDAGVPEGVPVVVLHGGPGSGSALSVLARFDLARFRVVLIDQRGAGASRPRGSVRHNRTDRLIGDIEAVRERLGVARWGVVGGSWGAALALAYAGAHAHRVTGVVLRGLFLTSRREVRGLFIGSRGRAPREWGALMRAARCDRASALLACCARALSGNATSSRQREIAFAWRAYEDAILASAHPGRPRAASSRAHIGHADALRLTKKYRIQAHYLAHDCWLGERRLLALARRAALTGVPIAAVHGMRDPVCPPGNIERLSRAIPDVRLSRVPAGHLGSEPTLAASLSEAIRAMFR